MTTPSWQPDQLHRHEFRWWDGQQWTEHVSDHGIAGVDPLHPADTPPPTWSPPTITPPPPSQETEPAPAPTIAMTTALPMAPPRAPARSKGMWAAAGIVVVAALGAGAFLLFRDDGDTGSLGGATVPTSNETFDTPAPTVAPTVATTAAPPLTITTPSTAAPTLPPTTLRTLTDDELMMLSLPQAGEVPADWVLYSEATAGHEPTTDTGYCNGPNGTAIAIGRGSAAQVDGPSWDLPSGAWFGVEEFAFATPADASAFLADIAAQTAACSTAPATRTEPESDLQIFDTPADTIWQIDSYAGSAYEAPGVGDEVLMVTSSDRFSTTMEGIAFAFVEASEVRFERYGRFVVEYWADGQYGFTGFTNTPEWDFTPTATDAAAGADQLRATIRARLGS